MAEVDRWLPGHGQGCLAVSPPRAGRRLSDAHTSSLTTLAVSGSPSTAATTRSVQDAEPIPASIRNARWVGPPSAW
jgi:hypothetical protein